MVAAGVKVQRVAAQLVLYAEARNGCVVDDRPASPPGVVMCTSPEPEIWTLRDMFKTSAP